VIVRSGTSYEPVPGGLTGARPSQEVGVRRLEQARFRPGEQGGAQDETGYDHFAGKAGDGHGPAKADVLLPDRHGRTAPVRYSLQDLPGTGQCQLGVVAKGSFGGGGRVHKWVPKVEAGLHGPVKDALRGSGRCQERRVLVVQVGREGTVGLDDRLGVPSEGGVGPGDHVLPGLYGHRLATKQRER
jgi:hypothetical protein